MGSFRHPRSRRRSLEPRLTLRAKVFDAISLGSFGFVFPNVPSNCGPTAQVAPQPTDAAETFGRDGTFRDILGHFPAAVSPSNRPSCSTCQRAPLRRSGGAARLTHA